MIELWDILDEHGKPTGQLKERGHMMPGEFHLIVHVWILNNKGEFLISKRTSNKPLYPNMWETVGGSAVAGDDGITTAIKEAREELGVYLDPKNGQLFKHYRRVYGEAEFVCGDFVDVWLFRQDADLKDVVLCPDETCDAMLADKDKIRKMVKDGIFIGYSYLDELLNII